MKTVKNPFIWLALALCLCVGMFVPGCAGTQSQQRKTFNTLWSLASTVDTGYKGYWDLVIRGQLKTNSVPAVSRAYSDFQLSLNVALLAVAGNSNAVPPPAVINSFNSFGTTLSAAKGNL